MSPVETPYLDWYKLMCEVWAMPNKTPEQREARAQHLRDVLAETKRRRSDRHATRRAAPDS